MRALFIHFKVILRVDGAILLHSFAVLAAVQAKGNATIGKRPTPKEAYVGFCTLPRGHTDR